MLLAPHPSLSPTPPPAIRRVYSWLKSPSLTLSQIGTQSDGERRDGARLSCFIQFHYSTWGGVSVLTLLCQHSGRGSCAVVAEAWHQCGGLSHQESTVKSLPADQLLSKGVCLSVTSDFSAKPFLWLTFCNVDRICETAKSLFWCSSSNTFFSYFLLIKYVPLCC